MNLKQKWKNLKIHSYYYVPVCPVCGSQMTGRFILDHRTNDINYIINDALKHGELVRPVGEIPEHKNAFCVECDNEWLADIKFMFISKNQLSEEKRERNTYEILKERIEEQEAIDSQKSRLARHITGFIGKI